MFKWLFIVGIVALILSGIGLFSGLASQQPIGFGLALLCGFPGAMFFLGGATFSFAANYQISPKMQSDTQKVGSKSRNDRLQGIG